MVHKKGPLRSLSIVVDPTHRLLTDESDRVRAGRIVLDGAGASGTTNRPTLLGTTTVASSQLASSAIVPPSPSPNGSFIFQQQNSDHPPADSVAGGSAPDPAVPVGDSLRQPFTLPPRISVVSSPDETPSPSLPFSSFSQSLAARRRSSVVSLPPLPPNSHSRARNDSITSLASINQPQSRTAAHRRTPSLTGGGGGGGRAEEDGFSYLNSAASSQSALSNISMPAPYQHGPIQVLPGIWLGCEENARDWESLKRCNIGSILNVAKEISNVFGGTEAAPASSSAALSLAPPPPRVRSTVSTPNLSKFSPQPSPKPAATAYTATFHPADPASGRPDLHYLHLPWSHGQSDLVSNGFPQAFAFADESIVKRGKGVLVHCQCGVSRSATLVIALVMRAAARPDATEELKNIGTSMHGAYEFVKEKSVCIGPNMSLIYQLLEYEKRLHPTRPALVHTNTGTESDSAASIHSSPVLEDPQYASEEDRIRAEEEQWARMRKQMEEEEEREREESLRAITVNVNAPRSLVDEEEEAMNLDRAMEERLQLRRQSSVASASVASSSSSTGAGGLPTWKTRFGGAPHRRVRAGSVESNFTGRSVSMVSVEEEDEEEDEQDGGEKKVSRKWTIKKPTALRSRTVSTATSSAVSDADADVEEDRMDWRSSTLHHQDQPPLSANTTNTNASSMLETPLTPHLPGGAGGVQIVVEDATPLANRHLGGASMMMALDSPTPRRGKRGGMSFDLGLGLPPPSASHFKTSFGAPELPPPSASHVKMSFGAPPIPPPSASHMKTSFGAPQPPPSASHTKMSFGAPQPPTASQLRMSFESDEDAPVPFPSKKSSGFGAQLAAKRAAKKAKMTLLEPVPSSPPVAMVGASPPKSMMSMLERRSSAASVRSSSSSSAGSFRFGVRATSVVERSPSPPTVELVNAEADLDVGGSRKRTKSRPVPAPLALKRAATSSSSSSLEPSAAYVLSSGHRSKTSSMSSTSSSSSSSSSANRLRNKLLNRVSGGRASPATPHPAAAATTPHQTLFIFPPSPTGSSTLPSSTPSAMMLTTNYRQHPESSSIPMLTPTPTLATFMSGEQQRRRNVSRKASSSSSSSNGGGWMGGMPSTPTTACARVDARGWVGR